MQGMTVIIISILPNLWLTHLVFFNYFPVEHRFFVYSDTLKDNSAGYKQSATVNLPNDIGAVVGLFSCKTSASTVSTGSHVFNADNHPYTVYLSGNPQNMSNLTVNVKLTANYSQATITPSTGPTYIAILAW